MRALSAAALVSVLAATGAHADTLAQERLTAIYVAFEMHGEHQPDRLMPAEWEVMQAAYSTHNPKSDVDALPHERWEAMLEPYESLTHTPDVLASLN